MLDRLKYVVVERPGGPEFRRRPRPVPTTFYHWDIAAGFAESYARQGEQLRVLAYFEGSGSPVILVNRGDRWGSPQSDAQLFPTLWETLEAGLGHNHPTE